MASVTGMTAEKIDELMDDMVIGVEVDDNGQLIYTKRSGEQLNAGSLTSSTAAVEQAYPVSSLFMCTVPTSPAVLLGIGTWVRFGKGKALVGLDETLTTFDAVEETGGVKEVTLTTQQLPAHTHAIPAHTHTIPPHTHSFTASYTEGDVNGTGSSRRLDEWYWGTTGIDHDKTGTTGASAEGITGEAPAVNSGSAGGASPHTNLQPYVVVYIWKRTA